MSEKNQRRGRLVLIAFGVVALIFIIASLNSNLNIWRQNDAAEEAAQESVDAQ
ncbi:hypothetical protein [Devosia sp. RR2S18]|jgi:hypothetical protein|uniref:hypothetical protein n=1 Tax=Devosia rhizosphaerae TaxID=3049774 RepID=UPI00253FCAA4|nr:hypothetical protein [Devosia sp. RR2S18]WIJ26109.1 hypothetical protein QOV41_04900 [Devosia sp. RR2S18]